ncbi:MAG TPA: baseplate J/gp47 family protein [Actinomycetota bacterium]|nr:baseplate J/gp47 family protein [Actinomycetota bacterium]
MMTGDRRQALVLARTVNGVDFVEVDPASDTVLVVHFVFALPGSPPGDGAIPADPAKALAAPNFQVTGGERITGIRVLTATPRAGAPDQMDVVVDRAGDFSVYTLSIVAGPGAPGAPDGFDPASTSADFVFHIECAGDFDCAPEAACPPEQVMPPPINYLAKDYPGFVQVLSDRLALLAPRWAERNPADLGVALVELLAYVGDQLSYREDVIATEAYLGTARLRTSVRRHARLVDYPVGEGCNARAWLRVLVDPGGAADGSVLPPGTRCATDFPGAPAQLTHDTATYRAAVDAGAVFFETAGASPALYAEHQAMVLYAWSQTHACLAVGATHATLVGTHSKLAPGMVLVLAEVKGPLTGSPADADPGHRQAVRVTAVASATDPVTGTAITEIDWHPGDALAFPLCVASIADAAHQEQAITGVAEAWGNIVLADQGRSVGGAADPLSTGPEWLGVVPPAGRFRPALANGPVTFARAVPGTSQPASAASATSGTPVPEVVLMSGNDPDCAAVKADPKAITWTPVPSLLETSVTGLTPVFVPEVETGGTAYLLFGDGVNGLEPEPGSGFCATYRVGNGTAGNVARGALTLLDRTGFPAGVPAGVLGVTNPMPAWGGVDPEPIEHVRQSAPAAFFTQQRAVTAADYRARTLAYPGVQRAEATLRWTGSWHTMFITVERDAQAALDAGFIAGLEAYLDGYRMAGVDLEVEDGVRVPLHVAMDVCVQPGYVAAGVRQALRDVFSAGTLPDGSPGLFNPARLNLGQPFYLSPLYAAAQAVDGVRSVEVTAFERQDRPGGSGLAQGVLTPERLEFFLLDNDPNFPERGRFDLSVAGGR